MPDANRWRFLIVLMLVLGPNGLAEEPGELAERLPRIKPTEPAEALKTFSILDGFRVELAAHEPEVVDPVDAAFDESGRLWVAEMRGYPFPEEEAKPVGRVRVLSDTDGDGRFETSQILADELFWPTGIAVWRGGCFVIAAPDLWYIKDEDGDGKAEIKERVFTGFEKANVQALANNLKWGLDGWIYGASSSNGGIIKRVDQPNDMGVSIRGRDFRFDPSTRRFEAISGTAQFGNCFDDAYNRFVCSNSDHAVQVVLDSRYLANNRFVAVPTTLASIAKDGGAAPVFRKSQVEPWRIVRTERRASSGKPFASSELHASGFFTSASGITIYRGDKYPEAYHGNLFVGDVGGNLVHRKKLVPHAPTFTAERVDDGVEFLTSTDNWFRPVNFVNGPDGALYVLDMYRETIEHPWSIPEDIKAHLDLVSGQDRGRIYRIVPPDFKRPEVADLGKQDSAALIKLLGHPNAWHRETAARLLIDRTGEKLADELRASLDRPSTTSDLHVMHTLGVLKARGELQAADLLRRNVRESENPIVRAKGILFSEPWVATDPELQSRVLEGMEDSSPEVRWQAALTAGFIQDGSPAKVDAFARRIPVDGGDRWMRTALLLSCLDIAPSLFDRLVTAESKASEGFAQALAQMIGAQGDPNRTKLIAESLTKSPWDENAKLSLVAAFADGLASSRAVGTLWKSIAGTPAEDRLNKILDDAEEIALNDEASASARTSAVGALALRNANESLGLIELLDAHQPRDLQLAALSLIGQATSADVGAKIVAAWPSSTPGLRAEMVEVLLSRPERHAALLEAIEKGDVVPGQLSSAARERLARSPNADVAERAKSIFKQASANRQGVIADYRSGLMRDADLAVGRKVFERECATCHRLSEKGHDVGPNLATITNRTPAQLVEHILDPNLEVLPAFLEYSVILDDGRVATGIIASETATSMTLKRAEGVTQTISRDQIDEIRSTGKSLMPEGLEQKISKEEMADLVGYLLDAADSSRITGTRR